MQIPSAFVTGGLPDQLLHGAPAAALGVDAAGSVILWNEAAERLFGHRRSEALGRAVEELLVPERLRSTCRPELEGLLRNGHGPILDAPQELAALRADGSEISIRLTVTAVGDGDARRFYAFATEATAGTGPGDADGGEDRHERLVGDLRRALHGSERRFDAIVGALSDAVTIRDRSDRIIYANQAAVELLGYASWDELRDVTPTEIMGDYRVLDEHGRPLTMDDVPSVRILRGEPAEPLLIQTINRRTGRRRWELLKSAPLTDETGAVDATIMITEDVTEQKRAEQEATFLARASEILSSSLDYEQTLRNVAELAVPGISDWCAVDLVGERGERRPVAVAHSDPGRLRLAEELREYEPEQLDPRQGLGRVFATGQPELYPEIPDELIQEAARSERHLALLRAVGFRSAMIVPMRIGDRTLGAMTLVTSDSERRLDALDLRLAEQVAARAAVAIENARLYGERSQIAHTLQQSLLPEELPEIPGYELATVYAPAVQGSEVGGDFYDAWEVEGGWMLVIGDVTGKGVKAAALTSLVRYTLRAASAFEQSPARLLAHVDRALKSQRGLSICTALCVRLVEGEATVAVGGHPLPLYLSGGDVRPVGTGGPLLGAFSEASWMQETFEIEPGATLVTYTDGVTDALGEDRSRYGYERLFAALSRREELSAVAVAQDLREELERFQTGPHADDTAVLVLHRRPGMTAGAGAGAATRLDAE